MTGSDLAEPEVTADAAWAELDPRGAVVTATAFAGAGVAAAVPILWGVGTAALVWVVLGIVLLTAAGAVTEIVRRRFTRYRVGPDRVELRDGVVSRNHRTLPRERIRVVDLSADPLSRTVGLVQVKIGTGEQGGEGLTIWPVTAADGERMRAELTRVVEETADGRLATLRPAWLGLSLLSFVTPALGLAAGGVIVNVSEWFGLQGALFSWVGGLATSLGLVLLIVLGAAAVAVVGTVGALAIHVELWWGHRLDREPGQLRVRRGLLTRRSISLEERRLRGVDLVEPLTARLAGAARLDAVATGMTKPGEEDKAERSTLMPSVPRAEALRVARSVLGERLDVPLDPHPRAARGRRVRWALLAVAGTGLLLAGLGLLWWPLLHAAWIAVLLGLPIALALAFDAYRALGHALTDRYLVARHGTVRRTTVALDRNGIVGWTVRRTLFQRRLGLLTVRATTGAGGGAYSMPDVGESEGLTLAGRAGGDVVTQFLVRRDT